MARFILMVALLGAVGHGLELKNGAYEDLVVTVAESVPVTNCKAILTNLEATLTSASQYLFSALDGRAFLRSTTILLPPSWPETCVSKPVVSGSGETPDVTISPTGPARGRLWTQQSAGCGQPGDQIYLGFEALEQRDDTLARSLVKEFAMYRYGVFEEQGYFNDPVYPMCYYDDKDKETKITGCSDLHILDNGICDGSSTEYNTTKMVDDKARSSIMFAAEAPSVSMFCDEGTHDRYAPTKHNLICQRRSTFEVIINHPDFANNNLASHQNSQIQNTRPKITYKKHNTTRFVLVIENTKDMVQRESWSFLRTSIRKWAVYDLPENVEVGLVLTNETGAVKLLDTIPMRLMGNRDMIASAIPYTAGDSTQSPCLHCALKEAINMLNERTRMAGPASNVIIVMAPGMNTNAHLQNLVSEANKSRVKIATINYPDLIRTETLDALAVGTHGESFTVIEKKVNVDTSILSTYFQLSNVLYNIINTFCPYAGLPIEIHRREIIKNDHRNSITGSFMLDDNMAEPARFMLYTHNSITPLIKSLTLTSPSLKTFTTRSDSMLTTKIITLNANINETGTWTYTIEPFPGNPQPHYLQVIATPKNKSSPVVRAKFWVRRNSPGSPLILYTEIKRGDYPILGAKVEVLATKSEANGSVIYKETFELLDTGSGDPDITKGDGIYTRYFSAAAGGPGTYTFQVTVTDNGNNAYSWSDTSDITEEKPCCGSRIRTSNVESISPFQRVLPSRTIEISSNDIIIASQIPVGRIGDLKVEVIPEDMKARLTWTSPDMGGHNVARYVVKYANNVEEISDRFDTNAMTWEGRNVPLLLAPGSETTFSIDMSQDREMLDKPLYFAIRAYAQMSSDSKPGPISNWVRVLVPSPPPPPTVAPTYTTNDSSWPIFNSNGGENAGPSIAKSMNFGLEIILPIVIGFILLVVLLILYCYFCVIKRKTRGSHKKSNQIKTDKLNSTITIVPSSPTNNPQNAQQETYSNEYPDHHTVGVPVSNYGYEDEPKKRYSLVHQQEQQLIEELKQQQMQRDQMNTPNNNYGGLSVISNNTLQRNGHTLSPYNSWSASQLLHEHERRHSPMENMMQDEQMMTQHQDAMSQLDHMSINGQPMHDQMMAQIPEHYVQGHVPPPVPPLPAFPPNGYPVNYNIYGVHQPQNSIYQSMQRNEPLVPFNPSLQGSMSSVNSSEKKRRNVTMV